MPGPLSLLLAPLQVCFSLLYPSVRELLLGTKLGNMFQYARRCLKPSVFKGSQKTVNHLSFWCLIWGPCLLLSPYNGKEELETFHLIICQQDSSKFWKSQPVPINKIEFSCQFLLHLYMVNKYLFLQMKCINKDSVIMKIMLTFNSYSATSSLYSHI